MMMNIIYDRETYGDSVYQRCTVNVLVGLFNVTQIDFGSAHDDSDQLTVVGAHTRHGGFQLIGVVVALLLGALHCGHKRYSDTLKKKKKTVLLCIERILLEKALKSCNRHLYIYRGILIYFIYIWSK